MIKRLRKYFIAISLVSILFVLSMSLAAINIHNFHNISYGADDTLVEAIKGAEVGFYGFYEGDKNGDESPLNEAEKGEHQENGQAQQSDPHNGNSSQGNGEEDGNQFGDGKPKGGGDPHVNPFDGRFDIEKLKGENYFAIRYDSNGVMKENTDFNNASRWIDESTVRELGFKVFSSDKNYGNINNLRYKKVVKENDTYVALLDITRQLKTAERFLGTSLIAGLISFLVLGGLIVLASFIIFKPSEQAYQKQKKFITNASHELKTPLTIINTDLEIIEMDNGANEWTDSIKDQVNRLTVMTNQLVTLSRLDESNKENYPFEVFSLSEIVNKSIEAFIPLYEKQGLSLKCDISEDIDVKGNESLINQLIYILLDNANKYAKDKVEIFVSLSKNNKNQTLLNVSNDIEEDNQIDVEQLFDRFYRAPTAKSSGSGIGLSIASEIVKLHKGQIAAYIENNKIYFEVILK